MDFGVICTIEGDSLSSPGVLSFGNAGDDRETGRSSEGLEDKIKDIADGGFEIDDGALTFDGSNVLAYGIARYAALAMAPSLLMGPMFLLMTLQDILLSH
jgi:hypothetical protein